MWEGSLANDNEFEVDEKRIQDRIRRLRTPSTILEGKLYLSCDSVPEKKEILDQYQIKGIVVALSMDELIFYQYHPDPMKYCIIPICDYKDEPIETYFDECFRFIDDIKGAVLVHCAAGVSRSATLVIAYLMTRKKMSFLEAHFFVKERRPIIRPNDGFMQKLQGNI